ncbi:hypothetical protein EDD17DRAFT_815950 [Pisolithus thermaeus]|nr:hypothetical protein EV401DRAFT_41472 [Pisolithus croceorrhizus]KAI6160382.1 hypothetical protein EDD17DRAFT_815950 [Pisolithus thermaeus]
MFSVSLFVLALPVVRTNVMDSSVDTALHILCREEDENAFMIVAVLAIASGHVRGRVDAVIRDGKSGRQCVMVIKNLPARNVLQAEDTTEHPGRPCSWQRSKPVN